MRTIHRRACKRQGKTAMICRAPLSLLGCMLACAATAGSRGGGRHRGSGFFPRGHLCLLRLRRRPARSGDEEMSAGPEPTADSDPALGAGAVARVSVWRRCQGGWRIGRRLGGGCSGDQVCAGGRNRRVTGDAMHMKADLNVPSSNERTLQCDGRVFKRAFISVAPLRFARLATHESVASRIHSVPQLRAPANGKKLPRALLRSA